MNTEFDLYIDMDGVLADFDAYVTEANNGIHPVKAGHSVWKHITDGSFAAFPKMADAQDLWDYVLPYDPVVLTATGYKHEDVRKEKTQWLLEHFDYSNIMTCQDGKDKITLIDSIYHAQSILVDDRTKAIDPWIEAGGIGILHTSAEDSINQLKLYLET